MLLEASSILGCEWNLLAIKENIFWKAIILFQNVLKLAVNGF
jgi:hypothetical protein